MIEKKGTVHRNSREGTGSTCRGGRHFWLLSPPPERPDVGLVRWAVSRTEGERRCRHLALSRLAAAAATPIPRCQRCVSAGATWRGLRLCRSCGHVGCCERSKNGHSEWHFRETGHPIVDVLGPPPAWTFCYIDQIRIFA
jgi:hypothetical protein